MREIRKCEYSLIYSYDVVVFSLKKLTRTLQLQLLYVAALGWIACKYISPPICVALCDMDLVSYTTRGL